MSIKKLLEQWQEEDKYDGPERRKFARLVWPSSKRATLKIKEREFEVIDISERGLKLSDYIGRGFGEKVYGTVEFLSGESMDVTGEIAWQSKDKFGLLTNLIPRSIIIEEIRNLLRKIGSIKGVQKIDEDKNIICPNCHFEQIHSQECIQCGIIISKYKDIKPEGTPHRKEISLGRDSEVENTDLRLGEDLIDTTDTEHKWILSRIIPEKLEYFFRNVFKGFFTRKNPYFKYGAKVLDISIQAIILLLITGVLCIILLYLGKMMWFLYMSTPMGQKFLELSPQRSKSISYLLSRNLFNTSTLLTLQSFLICLGISALCQILHIARYLYQSRGLIGKIGIWGLSLAALVAIHIQSVLEGVDFVFAYALAVVPTLCLFTGCFKFSYELLPEIGDILQKIFNIRNKISQTILPKLMQRIK